MTDKALTKIWSFFAFALLSFAFLATLRTTGVSNPGGNFGLLGYQPSTVAALALPLDLLLCAIVFRLTAMRAARYPRAGWSERMPLFYFEPSDVDPRSREGRNYQRVAVLLVLVVPLLLTAQMADRFLSGQVHLSCRCHGDERDHKGCGTVCVRPVSESRSGHFNTASLISAAEQGGMLRFGEKHGPEYLPWSPWVYLVLALFVMALWLHCLWMVFRPTSGAEDPASHEATRSPVDTAIVTRRQDM